MLNHPTKRRWHSKTLTKHLADIVVVVVKHGSLVISVSHPRGSAYGNDNGSNGPYRTNDETRLRNSVGSCPRHSRRASQHRKVHDHCECLRDAANVVEFPTVKAWDATTTIDAGSKLLTEWMICGVRGCEQFSIPKSSCCFDIRQPVMILRACPLRNQEAHISH